MYIYIYMSIYMLYMYICMVFVKAIIIHQSAQLKSVLILWEEDDAKQLYLVLKVSCRWTDNLSVRFNDYPRYNEQG